MRQAVGVTLRKILGGELREQASVVYDRTGMNPGNGLDRRLIERAVLGNPRTADIAGGECTVAFAIGLLDPAKATEFALGAVEVAVVIAVGRRKRRAAPLVRGDDPADAMDRKRQARYPRRAGVQILQIKARRGRVFDRGGGAEVVIDL
ncbi:MAG TPA: hypothetical protein VLA64_10830, partial [Azonexus sp.]|nr:hypothetical protein [Azonexus sp.]